MVTEKSRCGDCFWWKPARLEAWAAPVASGVCTFGPAPQVLDDHRAASANDGRACPVFTPQEPGRAQP